MYVQSYFCRFLSPNNVKIKKKIRKREEELYEEENERQQVMSCQQKKETRKLRTGNRSYWFIYMQKD